MAPSAQHNIVNMTWIAIAVGDALGSLARHGVNHLVHVRWLTLQARWDLWHALHALHARGRRPRVKALPGLAAEAAR